MRRCLKYLLPYLFPTLLIIVIFSYFLNTSTYKYINPRDKLLVLENNSSENIKQNIAVLKKRIKSIDQENGKQKNILSFILGYLYFNSSDFKNAEKVLLRGINENNIFLDYSLFYLARITSMNNDFKQSNAYLNKIIFKQTTLKPQIIELYGLNYYELGFFDKAASYYEKLLKNHPQTKKNTLKTYLTLANIYRNLNNFSGENKILKEIMLNHPTESITSHIKSRFESENFSIHSDLNDLSELKNSLLKEANGFFEGKDFDSAINVYKKYLSFFPSDSNKLHVLNRMKYCYKLSNKENAFSSILEKIVNLSPDEGSLSTLGANYFSNEDYNKALEIYQKLIINFPSSPRSYKYLYNLGRINEITKNYIEADFYFKKIIESKYIKTTSDEKRYIQNSIFKRGWIAYKQNKFFHAKNIFSSYLDHPLSDSITNKLLYWIGVCYEKLGLVSQANNIFSEILKTDKYSYYGIKALEKTYGFVPKIKIKENSGTMRYKTRTVFLSSKQKLQLKRIELLLLYNLKDFAQKELSMFKHNSSSKEFNFYLATLKNEVGDILGSLQILNKQTSDSYENIPLHGLKLLWPKKYWDLIGKHSQSAQIDPYFTLSIIRQESAFNPNAVSIANAMGLMQILPYVADNAAKEINIENFDLFDPSDNILISTHFMATTLKYYSNLIFAIAAYNAGNTPVNKWLARFNGETIEEFIEEIPYSETYSYVKHVLRNYINFKRIYRGHSDITPINTYTTDPINTKHLEQ